MLDLGGIPAAQRGPHARPSAGHRRRSRGAEPGGAGPVHRPVRHRRRRGEPALDHGALDGAEGARRQHLASRHDRRASSAAPTWAYAPDVLRAGIPRRRHHRRHAPHPRATCRARSWPAPSSRTSTPFRCRPGRSCRSSRRRTTASPSRSCAAVPGSAASASPRSSSGRCGCARWKPSCRPPWRATATPATTKSACSASAPAIIPYFEELVKRMHEVFAPLGVNISLPSLRVNHQLRIAAAS